MKHRSSVFPARCVGSVMCWNKKCSDASSCNSDIIAFSSLLALANGVPSGHFTCGRFISPHKTISGIGVGRAANVPLIFSNDCRNSVEVDLCPPLISSGCRYIANSTRFWDLTYTPSTSTTPLEKLLDLTESDQI